MYKVHDENMEERVSNESMTLKLKALGFNLSENFRGIIQHKGKKRQQRH